MEPRPGIRFCLRKHAFEAFQRRRRRGIPGKASEAVDIGDAVDERVYLDLADPVSGDFHLRINIHIADICPQ